MSEIKNVKAMEMAYYYGTPRFRLPVVEYREFPTVDATPPSNGAAHFVPDME